MIMHKRVFEISMGWNWLHCYLLIHSKSSHSFVEHIQTHTPIKNDVVCAAVCCLKCINFLVSSIRVRMKVSNMWINIICLCVCQTVTNFSKNGKKCATGWLYKWMEIVGHDMYQTYLNAYPYEWRHSTWEYAEGFFRCC